ncbi:hypothetical protein AG0111_0g11722 [Alternaria gaisen]|uniref:Uncharacterized protein n=1 Tax=Alternaria gaisen TaxID=167740 RepID=A0ACB6F6V7_9PLEO|nr:hypothetical protein AG0111_0g11722 [Alternaria gaisen]
MAQITSAQAIERIVGYEFRSRHDDLQKALRAAGAVEEDWDGNRKLAQLGTALSEFLLNYLAFEAGVTRAYANDFKTRVTSNEHRASIARRTGISDHITFNEQEGAQSASVLAKAVNAVIAVIFFDSGQDIGVVLKTMRHLGVFTLAGQSVDPTLLSLDEIPNSLDVKSLAQSLFNIDTNSHLLSTAASNDRSFLTRPSTQLDSTTNLRTTAAGQYVFGEVPNGSQRFPIQDDYVEDVNVESAADYPLDAGVRTAVSIVSEGEGAAGRCDTIRAAGQPGKPTGKRGDIDQGESGHRRKLRRHDTPSSVDLFRTYLAEEERKCEAWGHQTPQDTFLTPPIQRAIHNLSKGKTEVMTRILIHIGSPCLIGGLQDILDSCKTQERCMASEAMGMVSRAERIRLIVSLGHTMSRSQLIRRYHVLQLFKDCGGPDTLRWEIAVTPSSLTQRSGKRGNPLNRSVADLTARMMQEAFPAVDPGTNEYKTKYRWFSDTRRLGHRLHMLEARFGEGVLGLMLDQGVAGTDIGITDKM